MSAASNKQLSLFDFQPKRKKASRQPFASVEAYLGSLVESRLTQEIFDNREIRKIARICKLHPDDVRTQLRRCGYEKTTNPNGLVKWVRKEEAGHEM